VRAFGMTQNQTPEAPSGMGLEDQREEATAFWRALTLSDFSAAREVLRKVTPITPGAFVFPEADEDVVAGDETKGASQAALLSPLYITMKSTASQMSLFYVEADQYCMAPISKRKGGVYKLCGSKSAGVGTCTLASHVKQRDPRLKVGKSVLAIGVPSGKKVDRAAVFSEVLAQPLPSFLRPSGGEKADERFVELLGARASYGVWLALLVHFPALEMFIDFVTPKDFGGGESQGVLSVDTSDKGTVPARRTLVVAPTISDAGPGLGPGLRAEMEAMVERLRVEMRRDFAEVRCKQDEQADGLSDGVIGLGSLQQELEDLRVRQRARQAVGGGSVQPEREAMARALAGELTALSVNFESVRRDLEDWRRDLDGPGGTIEGLEASIEKGVQRSRDNVVTVGGESFAGAPEADALVSTWKPEAWGCLISFHLLLSLTSNPNEDYTGVMLTEKARAAAGFETVLGSKVYAALQTKYPPILRARGSSVILKDYVSWVGPQQTGIKFDIERGVERVSKQIRARTAHFFADGSKGKAICDDALVTATAHVLSFLSFVGNFYEEIHTAGVKKTEAWGVVRRCVEKVFDEIETEHAAGQETRDAGSIAWAILSGHRAVANMAKDRFINSPALTSIMVRTVLENQGSEDREGGAAMSKDAERKVTLLNSTVALLKQDVGQLKANEIKLKDRLKKLEEKE
jgi:hypothetical protein